MQRTSRTTQTRGDTFNDASVFWAMVINNALVALGLPIIGGLLYYKRRQVKCRASDPRLE